MNPPFQFDGIEVGEKESLEVKIITSVVAPDVHVADHGGLVGTATTGSLPLSVYGEEETVAGKRCNEDGHFRLEMILVHLSELLLSEKQLDGREEENEELKLADIVGTDEVVTQLPKFTGKKTGRTVDIVHIRSDNDGVGIRNKR